MTGGFGADDGLVHLLSLARQLGYRVRIVGDEMELIRGGIRLGRFANRWTMLGHLHALCLQQQIGGRKRS